MKRSDVIADALHGIGRQRRNRRPPSWTMTELGAWAGFESERTARLAASWLAEAGFAEAHKPEPPTHGRKALAQSPMRWSLTMRGQQAVEAEQARRAAAHKVRKRVEAAIHPDSFSMRLWRLFRIRQLLTARDAAASLIDAGDDVDRAERAASQHLRRWHSLAPELVKVSAQPIDGHKRYVLQQPAPELPPLPGAPIPGGR